MAVYLFFSGTTDPSVQVRRKTAITHEVGTMDVLT